jgi:hypothetical protein
MPRMIGPMHYVNVRAMITALLALAAPHLPALVPARRERTEDVPLLCATLVLE